MAVEHVGDVLVVRLEATHIVRPRRADSIHQIIKLSAELR